MKRSMLDPRAKLLLLFQAGLWAVLLDRPEALGLAAALGVFALLMSGVWTGRWRRVVVSLGGLALVLWGMASTQAVFYRLAPRTEWIAWHPESPFWSSLLGPHGLALYREGFAYGLTQGLRLVLPASSGLALAFTTDPGELLAGLKSFRVPYGLAFMSVTALRFAPLLGQEAAMAWRAARLRGFHPLRAGPAASLSVTIGLMRPVLASCIRRSTTLAASVTSRGFDAGREAAAAPAGSFGIGSWAVALGSLAASLLIAAAKVLYLLYLHEIFYRSDLREVYQFVRTWL
ncbi:MAG: energy-coupling factor transporter transmembrane protein EcfT [Planctomycetota bacterium]|nr:energy-coupling factor transporter transmembrane protein EcfT [Planctomycetota bacterium]